MNVLLYGVLVVRSLLTQEAVVLIVPLDELQDENTISGKITVRRIVDVESRIEIKVYEAGKMEHEHSCINLAYLFRRMIFPLSVIRENIRLITIKFSGLVAISSIE
jgi:hypothetical protein